MTQTQEKNKILSQKIKEIAAMKEISLSEMAEKMQKDRQNIFKKLKSLEQGKGISTNSLFEFAEALGVSPAIFF